MARCGREKGRNAGQLLLRLVPLDTQIGNLHETLAKLAEQLISLNCQIFLLLLKLGERGLEVLTRLLGPLDLG
ncbi:hypothetical protein F441_22712 [Phytophthora nicotianae CJ01A1]|uniref:Uncharacterized protein n=1 Tax=Phytophthora nicotianae CJ01A1 TaxID=1317063 RepID=W2VNM7_PHYNI|nr:hypothetical protein F441_22712 [Phytophthora nicotianae CJ01A1]